MFEGHVVCSMKGSLWSSNHLPNAINGETRWTYSKSYSSCVLDFIDEICQKKDKMEDKELSEMKISPNGDNYGNVCAPEDLQTEKEAGYPF